MMSNWRSLIREFQERVIFRLRDDAVSRGFDAAASICLGVLDENIEDLHHKMRSGKVLDEKENLLLVRLNDMKSATRTALQEWGGSVS